MALHLHCTGGALLKAGALWRAGLRAALAGLVAFLPAQNAEATFLLKGLDQPCFIENKGQWPEAVLFLARLGGLDVWITREGMNLNFFQWRALPLAGGQGERLLVGRFRERDYEVVGHRVILRLVGANASPRAEGRQNQPGYHNYLIGNDPSRHASFVGLYREVVVQEVYPGIDMRYYFEGGQVRFDWVVRPGADPGVIRVEVEGADRVEVDREGRLRFWTRFGEAGLADLRVYQAQDGREVSAHFVRVGETCAIALGPYDRTQTLVIDPIVYATYIGKDAVWGTAIAVDGARHAYVTGYTSSAEFSTTSGAYQRVMKGDPDAFVAKLSVDGRSLVYATYLGGSGREEASSIAVDGAGHAYVTGKTGSTDFPVTNGAYQTIKSGQASELDAFVVKLSVDGSSLVYSTYLGGSASEESRGIAVDGTGHAYVTGWTTSSDFPVTNGAYQMRFVGGMSTGNPYDVFVAKLSLDGGGLVYSTYLGGSGADESRGIAVDAAGHAYITGKTESTDFPVTNGAYQTTNRGSDDAFVTKVSVDGSNLVYSTYLGGSGGDVANGIAVDEAGHAYVTGGTYSEDFPTAGSSSQANRLGYGNRVFVAKLSVDGTSLVYSTYLQGEGAEDTEGHGITVDRLGCVYITGRLITYETCPEPDGCSEALIAKLSEEGKTLFYPIYLREGEEKPTTVDIGESGVCVEKGLSIAVDADGYIYVVGLEEICRLTPYGFNLQENTWTRVAWFPEGPPRTFVKKLCPGKIISASLTSGSGTDRQTVCVNTPIKAITYRLSGTSKPRVVGLPSGVTANFSGGTLTIEGTPTQAGTFSYTVTAEDGCGGATGTLTVRPSTAITLTSAAGTNAQTVCVNTALTPITYTLTEATGATIRGLPTGVTGRFENGTLTISGTPTEAGSFTYTVTPVGGCGSASATGTIKVRPNTTAITLTSSPRTANQKVRANKKPIKPITYSVVDATGAEAKGLPPGVTGTYSGGVFTISGTPTAAGVFSYEVLPVGGCGDVKGTGLIIVRP